MNNPANLGWMIVATFPDGKPAIPMPTSPDALNVLPNYLHGTLPTFGGVWKDEIEARRAAASLPEDIRHRFEVVPVMVVFLQRN